LTETIAWARQHHISVILLGPIPEYDAPLPRLLGYSIAWHQPDYAAHHRITEPAEMDQRLQKLAESTWHVPYLSLYQALCSHGQCTEYADPAMGIPMLTDADHFTQPGSLYVMRKIAERGELP
jgi:hypothetical protein